MQPRRLSLFAYLLCVITMVYCSTDFYPRWTKYGGESAIGWDVSGYYWYLPAIFIYKDLKHQKFADSVLQKYQPTGTDFQQAFKTDNGNYVMKYSSGMAMMYSPFFFTAHAVAGKFGYPRDGFSPPYQIAIQFGGLLVALIGLWFFRRLLLLFYSDKVVCISILALVFGTNYINYSAIDTGMSHSWLFTLYVFLLLATIRFYKAPKVINAIPVGLLIGLATLIRPTEIISCLIPLLWGMNSLSAAAFKEKKQFLIQHLRPLLTAVVCAFLVMSVQAVYWKFVSGHWLVYSYQNQGFSWLQPHLRLYSFNYQCGWLTYCPLMMLAWVGLVPFWKWGQNKVAVIAFILLNFYIVSAWDVWQFGGRAMIQSYALMFFPFASLIEYMLERQRKSMYVLVPLLLIFTYLNVWIIYCYHAGDVYDTEFMNSKYYRNVVGRWKVPSDRVLALKDNHDMYEGITHQSRLLFSHDFEQDSVHHDSAISPIDGKQSFLLTKEIQNTDEYKATVPDPSFNWARAEVIVHTPQKQWNIWTAPLLIIRAYNKDTIVKENIIRIPRFLNDGDTKNLSIDLKFPKDSIVAVSMQISNNKSELPVEVDDIKMWLFKD